jgi:amidase
MRPLHELPAGALLPLLRRRELSALALVEALLERVAAEEPRVQAWQHLDPALARAQARAVDALPVPPPLAGLPVGVKDVFDTADQPTECGSPVHRGRRPERDATAVARLRAAGAVVLGKTVTTEFAFYQPGKTRNPRDPGRTPGGSSSGSAAAVAAAMVPVALGTQTAGSVIRPASFCGVVGLKLTHGMVPLDGVSPLAPSLDTLGLFGRRASDLGPLVEALGAGLPAARPRGREPRLGLCRTPQWALCAPESREAVERAAAALARAGAEVREVEPDLDGLFEAQRTIMAAEVALSFSGLAASRGGELSPVLRELIRSGEATRPAELSAARALAQHAAARLPQAFSGVDALLTPAALGEAPLGLAATGDPAVNRIWTLLGVPALALPAVTGPSGMPVGVQLVAPRRADLLLLDLGAWAEAALEVPREG